MSLVDGRYFLHLSAATYSFGIFVKYDKHFFLQISYSKTLGDYFILAIFAVKTKSAKI